MSFVKNNTVRDIETLAFVDIPNINLNTIGFNTKDEYIRYLHKFVSMYICITRRNDCSEDEIKQKLDDIIVMLHSKYEERFGQKQETTISCHSKL